jgi:hypothetical protein
VSSEEESQKTSKSDSKQEQLYKKITQMNIGNLPKLRDTINKSRENSISRGLLSSRNERGSFKDKSSFDSRLNSTRMSMPNLNFSRIITKKDE